MDDLGCKSLFLQVAADYFSQSDGTMPSARAPERDGQVALSFADVMRNQEAKEAFDPFQELAGLRERANVTGDATVLARERPEFWNEMRIWKKAHVENEIGIRRSAIAKAKADHRNEQRALARLLKTIDDELTQLVDVEFCGVDDYVGETPNRRHAAALLVNALGHRDPVSERMRAASLAKAAHQRFIARFDEYKGGLVITRKLAVKNGQLFDLLAFAGVDEKGGSFDLAAAFVVELAENGNQRYRKIIDAIKAQILEGVQHRAFAGT